MNSSRAIARQGARLATQRHRSLIQNLASEKGLRISQEEMDGKSKKQASRLIDRLIRGSPSNSFFKVMNYSAHSFSSSLCEVASLIADGSLHGVRF